MCFQKTKQLYLFSHRIELNYVSYIGTICNKVAFILVTVFAQENEERTGEESASEPDEVPVDEEVEALKNDLETTKGLVEGLKKKQEKQIKDLEANHSIQIQTKDREISSLKRQLNEALQKPARSETGTQTTSCSTASTTSASVTTTLDALMSEGTSN